MNHNTLVIEIKSTLDKLIAARTSLGYDYIVYGLLLINEDQTRVSNITKALYIDIAAHYETSWSCVEKNIRNTVNAIWTSENKTILEIIFNRTYMDRKPTNKEFFEYLYDFIFLSQETVPTRQYARTGVTLEEDAVNVSAVSQETVPVTDELMTEAEAVSSANKNYGEAQLVSVANNSGSKFFEEARLKRTKAHDEAMDSIQKALKSASLSTEEKKEYTSQLTGNLADLNAENEIETLVKAKGFADCLCFHDFE